MVLALVAGIVATMPFWFVTALEFQVLTMFWLPGLVLLVMVAGYLRPGSDDNAIWIFNARLALAIVLASVVGLIFFLGLVAIVESVEYLFSIRLGSDSAEHILCTATMLVGPIFGLSMVSRDLSEPFEPRAHSGLLISGSSLLLNYLLIPIALVYVAILYLYAGRILLNWELPRGQIGFMVLLFAIGGTGIWLIAKPWQRDGSVLIRTFQKSWFWLLIVPLGLLFVGLFRRVSEYGVTPERYGLAVVGLWAIVLVVWCAARSSKIGPRLIIGLLSVFLLLSSFGPWGANSVSVRSQYARLIVLLQEAGLLRDGGVGDVGQLSSRQSEDGRSIVNLLAEAGHLELLAPLFAGRADDPFEKDGMQADAQDIIRQLNMDSPSSDRSEYVYYSGWTETLEFAVPEGAVFYGGHRFGESLTSGSNTDSSGLTIAVSGSKVIISRGDDIWQVAVEDMFERARAADAAPAESGPLVFNLRSERGNVQLIVFEFRGRITDAWYEIEMADAIVLWSE
ncbi:DUF4153 domain-containing protein [Hoeflea sp. E7-10]|uniref:DUF4153 domain-containing protein n=1 Tax=Hoeflea poritis TaxID=2993659 RepID=A0ABT4VKE5_9HYPH|nr:DUF4153 domain-containing protein [Hoeflea poritis]MDA4844620.1 DUF4153 domain-containing protein [Hoeflea poritis]